MSDSILTSTKKILGIDEGYDVFDQDIVTFINAAFTTLSQLGIGPATGFAITDDSAKWVDFIGEDKNLNGVQQYIYMKVRMIFDPPSTSYLITALEKQMEEMEYRLSIHREATDWVPPEDPDIPDNDEFADGPIILDGGF